MMGRNAPSLPAETLATMVELLPTVGSLRDISGITGVNLNRVRAVTKPFLAIMKLNGTHPQCGCGKDRFHPYGCADSLMKAQGDRVFPGRPFADQPRFAARRAMIVEMLTAGDRFVDIDRTFGMFKHARSFLKYLTPDQLATRAANQAARGIAPRPKGGAA